MKLVKNVGKLPQAWSVQASALAAVLAVQEVLPIWEGLVPQNWFTIAAAVIATAAIALRGIDQGLEPNG